MPKIETKLPQVPDNPWKDLQFRFDGRWIPDVDPSLIGPQNYAKLENLRYKDSGLEGVNGYTAINGTPLATYDNIANGHQLRSDRTQKTYNFVHADNDTIGRLRVNRNDIGSTGEFDATNRLDTSAHSYYQDSANGLTGRFSDAPQGNMAYCNGREAMIFGGDEQSPAAVFSADDDGSSSPWNPTNPVDYTEELTSNITTETMTISTAGKDYAVLMTTRPIQGIKFYINGGSTGGTLTIKYWNGSSWAAVSDYSGGDKTSGLSSSGWYYFDHTKTTVKLKHYEDLYLYAYLIQISGAGATADIYNISVDTALQNVENVWDGVYRQPVQFQLKNTSSDTAYIDYTAPVNVASDEDNPVGGKLTSLETTGEIIVMFTEQMAGIRMQMLGALINEAAAGSAITVKYWDGSAYQAVGVQVDGTSAGTGPGFEQSGLISWIPTTTEKPRTLFNTFGYAYQIKVGTNVVPPTSSDVYIDLCTGIPALKDVKAYDFSINYGTRLMLCAPSISNEGNRMDFSAANAPDVFNGADSSNNGDQSLYFGGKEKITAGKALYNRFGSNLLSLLLVLKDSETYLLVGDTPDEFVIYEVSKTIGCPAPLTLATGEVNTSSKPTEGVTRNIAIWMSASGPVMFDGASISSIRGLENFFDPNNDEYINWSAIDKCRGWIDNVYKEYNLLIPSSSGQTTVNKWLVYDLLRRKWYEKRTGTASFPQSAWEVIDESGQRRNYGGTASGVMLYLENGTSWAGTGITQRVKTGDFFPSSNIWDETTIRKFKLLTHKFEEVSAQNYLDIYYYGDTEELIGSGITFVDTDDLTGVKVSFEDTTAAMAVNGNAGVEWAATSIVSINVNQDIGAKRIINIVTDENRTGWGHCFEFVITTTNVPRGFRPIAWGIRYRIERKGDQATQ